MLFALILGMTPPPPPFPDATSETRVCNIQLELPRGGIVVGKLCFIKDAKVVCDGEEMISVPDAPAFAESSRIGDRGVLLEAEDYAIREERYPNEARYLLLAAHRESKRHPYLSASEPIRSEVETRACSAGALYLDKGQDIVLFASGGRTATLGHSLRSFVEVNGPGPWLVAVFSRVK